MTSIHESLLEQAYAAVTDELNDGTPGQLTLEDLDVGIVAEAKHYAEKHNLPWPPGTGDYDRFWERKHNQAKGKP